MTERVTVPLTGEEAALLRRELDAVRRPSLTDEQKRRLLDAASAAKGHYQSLRDGQRVNRAWTAPERDATREELRALEGAIGSMLERIRGAEEAARALAVHVETLSDDAAGWLAAADAEWSRDAEAHTLGAFEAALAVLRSELGCAPDAPPPTLPERVTEKERWLEARPLLGSPWARAEDHARQRLPALRAGLARALRALDAHRAPTRTPDLAAGMVGLELWDTWEAARTGHGIGSLALEGWFQAAMRVATGKPALDGEKLLRHVRTAVRDRRELDAALTD